MEWCWGSIYAVRIDLAFATPAYVFHTIAFHSHPEVTCPLDLTCHGVPTGVRTTRPLMYLGQYEARLLSINTTEERPIVTSLVQYVFAEEKIHRQPSQCPLVILIGPGGIFTPGDIFFDVMEPRQSIQLFFYV